MKTRYLSLILYSALFFLGACSSKPQNIDTSNPDSNSNSEYTFLALGDSYTIGESVLEQERWPNQLADSLELEGFTFTEVQIIAKTGWTSEELQQGIEEAETAPPYDLVSLLIGVNNQFRGYDIDIYRKEFKELLEQAIEFAGDEPSNVFVVSIPNYGVTPFGQSRGEDRIRQELLAYDAIADSISNEYEIPFINITPISEDAKDDETLIAEDALHPSGKMYSLWVSEMLPDVISILNNQ